jgi:GAF domain-containing protein
LFTPLQAMMSVATLPLLMPNRTVGVLVIARDNGFGLDAAHVRMLDALSYYAALGVERV